MDCCFLVFEDWTLYLFGIVCGSGVLVVNENDVFGFVKIDVLIVSTFLSCCVLGLDLVDSLWGSFRR